jgi:ABC-type multidrug transport system ATPase subunit
MSRVIFDKSFDLDLTPPFKRKGLTLIVGRNGSGKTTLIRLLAKKYNVKNKEFEIARNRLEKLNPSCFIEETTIPVNESLKRIISYLDNIIPLDNEKIEDFLVKLNLKHILNQKFNKCSSGEKKKLLSALNLCQKNKFVCFLDEPTENIDNESKDVLINLLADLNKEIHLYITTHNPTHFSTLNAQQHSLD